MQHGINTSQTIKINGYQRDIPQDVYSAIQKASSKTGINFSYMLEKAAAESNFDTDIKASTSSATGLYQFIDSTWLNMVAEHGKEHGLGDLADKISFKNGRPSVSDAETKMKILELRKDAELSAIMAGEFTADNKSYLEKNTESNIGDTELYFAHFMGANGASKFLNSLQANPNNNAADIFPSAAKANKNVFFDKDGSKKTLGEVYAFFDKKFDSDSLEPSKSIDQNLFADASNIISQTNLLNQASLINIPTILNSIPATGGVSSTNKELNSNINKVSPDTLLMLAELNSAMTDIFTSNDRDRADKKDNKGSWFENRYSDNIFS